jgi:hypothetical protein
MDDTKLLSVTTTKLKQNEKQQKKKEKQIPSSNSLTLFGGLDDFLGHQQVAMSTSSPLLPSKGIPPHIFSKKKPQLPLKKVRRLKPDKEIQKILSAYLSEEMGSQSHLSSHSLVGENLLRSQSNERSERRLKAEIRSLPLGVSEKNVPFKLQSLDKAFQGVQKSRLNEMAFERTKALSEVESYINQMPLSYVFSKPELRLYALKRACEQFAHLAQHKMKQFLFLSFSKWKKIPKQKVDLSKLDEKQFGFLVISQRLNSLLLRQLKRYFSLWSFCYSKKFDSIRSKQFNDSTFLIQDWYRKTKILKKQPFRNLNSVIKMCLYRRRAIYYSIQMEHIRRKGLNKIRKGIATRRRYYYAARTIQRIIRWIYLYRHTSYRLIRQIASRKIQLFVCQIKKRSPRELLLLELGFYLGGYTRVYNRIPYKYQNHGRVLEGMHRCISTLQRWYLSCKGRLELFMKFAARRSAMEYEAKRNEKARIIQRLYRHHLWKELLRAALLNNRARRIQRGYRSYQYRSWVAIALFRRKERQRQKIFLFLRKKFWSRYLKRKFFQRKQILISTERRRQILARKIQRCYRAHVIYVKIKKEEMRVFFAAQRLKSDVVMASVRKIQLNFRNSRRPVSRLCRHVRLFALHDKQRHRFEIWKLVYRIQKIGRQYILKQRIFDLQKQVDAANAIWRLAKSYLLRKAIDNLVEITRRKRNAAAKKIQYNYRQFVWLRILRKRFRVMKARIELERLQNRSASLIQSMIRRKYFEYNTPVRIAARSLSLRDLFLCLTLPQETIEEETQNLSSPSNGWPSESFCPDHTKVIFCCGSVESILSSGSSDSS